MKETTVEPCFPSWKDPAMLNWAQILLNSYTYWTGKALMDRTGTPEEQGEQLFEAPFVVVSHGTQANPILNYGNRRALTLWEMDWGQFTQTPSRLTAEDLNQPERESMLNRAAQQGFISDYRGVRISQTGRRFLVEQATVWNILDDNLIKLGQAATFSKWTYL